MTDTSTTDKAQSAASTAADESKHVAGVAQGEAGKVAAEAKAQARSLAGEARTQVTDQVSDQTRQQRDRLVGTLGTLGDDLDQMAERSDGGLAADVAREAAAHARSLTSYLDGREPGELLDDVRDLARRRPALFLGGALVAGVVAGRLARGVKDAGGSPTGSPTPPSRPAQPSQPVLPAYDAPSALPGSPPVTPATTAAPPTLDPDPTQAFDPLAPTTPPPTDPPTDPPGYTERPYAGGTP